MTFYEKTSNYFEKLKHTDTELTLSNRLVKKSYEIAIHMSENYDFRTYGYSKYYKVPKSTFKIKNLAQKALLRAHDN